jgi:AcrR family transcriptional regulator
VRSTPVMDARVRKTLGRLRDALAGLVHEKSYDAIVVNEILERADVGRSAFYAHFHNKDALLASGIEQILHASPARQLSPKAGPFGKALWFSVPFLEHVGQCRHAAAAKMGRRGRSIVHRHLRRILTKQVRDELTAAEQASDAHATQSPSELLAEFIVGNFIIVLNWWVESDSPLSAREADDLFLKLVLPTLVDARANRTALPTV